MSAPADDRIASERGKWTGRISYAKVLGGYEIFRDGFFKVGVINTQHHLGLYRNGGAVYEPMERSSWTIHWTTPSLHVELIEAVLATMPKEA